MITHNIVFIASLSVTCSFARQVNIVESIVVLKATISQYSRYKKALECISSFVLRSSYIVKSFSFLVRTLSYDCLKCQQTGKNHIRINTSYLLYWHHSPIYQSYLGNSGQKKRVLLWNRWVSDVTAWISVPVSEEANISKENISIKLNRFLGT